MIGRGEAAERRDQTPSPDERQAEEQEEQEEKQEEEEEEEREEQAAQGAGKREWGVPTNQRSRKATRVPPRESSQQTGGEAASVAASEPTTPAAASDGAPARGVVEIDAASWASSVRERARAKAGVDQNGLASDATDDDGAAIQ